MVALKNEIITVEVAAIRRSHQIYKFLTIIHHIYCVVNAWGSNIEWDMMYILAYWHALLVSV